MEALPFACPVCGERMFFVRETTTVTYALWFFSEDGSSICKNLPLSDLISQSNVFQTENKVTPFLLCPACGAKYACHIRQIGLMRAVAERGERVDFKGCDLGVKQTP